MKKRMTAMLLLLTLIKCVLAAPKLFLCLGLEALIIRRMSRHKKGLSLMGQPSIPF